MSIVEEKESKKNIKFLKGTMVIQVVVLVVLLFFLLVKVVKYEFLGDFWAYGKAHAKCSTAYGCECPIIGKCKCIYYNDNDQPERIKCNSAS